MEKLLFLLFAPAPAFAGFSMGYAIRHPSAPDRMDATVVGVVCAVVWAGSVHAGWRWRLRSAEPLRTAVLVALCASAALGLSVFGMAVSGMLG